MKIDIYNVWCAVVEATANELAWLRHTLSYDIPVRGKKRQATYLRELNVPPIFPAGWAQSVIQFSKAPGAPPVQFTDRRQRPCVPHIRGEWLHAFQREALEDAFRHERGLVQLPTGAGKGEILSAIIEALPCKTLVLIRDASLLDQLSSRIYKRTGLVPGMIGGGKWSVGERVTVAMSQSISSHWNEKKNAFSEQVTKFLMSFHSVIEDEAHQSACQQDTRILESMHNAYFRIGLSATITGRSDQKDGHIIALFGRIVHMRNDQDIEELGKIAQSKILMHRVEHVARIPPYNLGGYAAGITNSQIRNRMVGAIWLSAQKPVLTYVRELDHGRNLLQYAENLGLKALFVAGETPGEARQDAIKALEESDIDILIGSDALKQGVDIVHVRELINAAGGKSSIPVVQRKGRGSRVCQIPNCKVCARFGRKDTLKVHDFYDVPGGQHPLLPKEKHWLEEHSKQRIRAYKSRGYEITEA